MKDAMISVRIPSSLVQELKELAEENHFLDLSEQIREIIRIKCSTQLEQSKSQLQLQTRQTPRKENKSESSNEKEKLMQNLQAILEQLKKEM